VVKCVGMFLVVFGFWDCVVCFLRSFLSASVGYALGSGTPCKPSFAFRDVRDAVEQVEEVWTRSECISTSSGVSLLFRFYLLYNCLVYPWRPVVPWFSTNLFFQSLNANRLAFQIFLQLNKRKKSLSSIRNQPCSSRSHLNLK
jgi:hypothetical protein